MKVAVVSESAADEEAIRILVEAILGRDTQPVVLRQRPGGWPSVRQLLPAVVKHLHYRTDAEALVLVVDSNRDPPHQIAHDLPGEADPHCRLCQLRQTINQVQNQLRPVPNRPSIKTAVGLAVPSIEAWYLCRRDPKVSEATWAQGLELRSFPYTNKGLKEAVYGIDQPPLPLETKRATEEAHRLAQQLNVLEEVFPNGFGALAKDVRSW